MMSSEPELDPQETSQEARSGAGAPEGVPTATAGTNEPQDAPAVPEAPTWPEAGSEAWYDLSIDPTTARLAYVVTGLWSGVHPLYQCRHCPWNTTEEDEARRHYVDNHTDEPGPSRASSGLVDGRGQPI